MIIRALCLSGYGDVLPHWGFVSICLELIARPVEGSDGHCYRLVVTQLTERCDL